MYVNIYKFEIKESKWRTKSSIYLQKKIYMA